MADPNLASIIAGQDPLSPQILQGLQGAQLSQQAAGDMGGGWGGVLAKFLAASQGHDMQNQAVQQTTQARTAAQPNLASLLAQPDPYQAFAQNPGQYGPIAGAGILSGASPTSAADARLKAAQAAFFNQKANYAQQLMGGAGGPMSPMGIAALGAAGGTPGTGAPAGGGGNISDPQGLSPYISQGAEKRGIDPGLALKVVSLEGGLAGATGDGGTSGGPFQLHVTPGGKGNAVGDQFFAQTGLNPLLPANAKATVDFALDDIAKNGWGAYKGAAKAGIAPFQGIARGQPGVPSTAAAVPGQITAAQAQKQALLSSVLGETPPSFVNKAAELPFVGPEETEKSLGNIKPFLGGERRGSPIFKFNPQTGSYDLAVQNPQLPEGAVENPTSGAISMAPGALPAIGNVEAAKAEAAGQYKPEIYYNTRGVGVQGTAAQAPQFANPAPGAAPPAPPATVGGMAVGGAIPGGRVAPPPLPAPPAAPQQPKQTPYGATPSFLANTPTGQKDISQVHINDMFPGGSGIPQPGGPAGPPDEMQKEIQKGDAERLDGYNKEQAGNQQINQDLLRLHGVLERGFSTSNVARIGADLANTAHGLGADWAYPAGWAPASAAEFDKASTDLVFAALKTLPGQVRVAEITGLQKANPNIVIPRETNYQMMNDILARSKWQDERARLATEFTVAQKGVPLSVFDSAYNRMAPLPDVANEYMTALRQHGAVFPEDVRAGGGSGAWTPPAAPTPGELRGGHIFKGGDPADRNSWVPAPPGAVQTR